MDEETYQQIPETLDLREIRFSIVEPGRRTRSIEIITTLIDADDYSKEDIAELYGFRWNSELDIRSIKSNLNLGHVRCKSPEMFEVKCGLRCWRIISSALLQPVRRYFMESNSSDHFTSTCQYVLAS